MRRIIPALVATLALEGCRSDRGLTPSDKIGSIGGDSGLVVDATDADDDGFTADEDCDDNDANVNPDADETCNGIDDNCDGEVDEGVKLTFYEDSDDDGYGDPGVATEVCERPDGYVPEDAAYDCDDSNADVHPGATEVCNGVDDDCDEHIDNDAAGATTWYRDEDSDGYGDVFDAGVTACEAPDDHVDNTTDCDDDDSGINPGAYDVCDGVDNNCDDLVDHVTMSVEGIIGTSNPDNDWVAFGESGQLQDASEDGVSFSYTYNPHSVCLSTDGLPRDAAYLSGGNADTELVSVTNAVVIVDPNHGTGEFGVWLMPVDGANGAEATVNSNGDGTFTVSW